MACICNFLSVPNDSCLVMPRSTNVVRFEHLMQAQFKMKLTAACVHMPDALLASFGCDMCHCQMQGLDDCS